jgi:hypothetical protein
VFELEILDLSLLFNGAAADNTRLHWLTLAGLTDDPFQINGTSLAGIERTTVVDVTGTLYLNIDGFVIALATFSLEQKSDLTVNDGGHVNITMGSILVLKLTDVYLFVGVGGVIEKDPELTPAEFVQGLTDAGSLGFYVSGASLTLAILSEAPGAASKSWIGLGASVPQMGVIGLPITITLKNLSILFNIPDSAGNRADWAALVAQAGDDYGIDGTQLANLDNLTDFLVLGSFFVSIESFVYLSGTIALQRRENRSPRLGTMLANTGRRSEPGHIGGLPIPPGHFLC